MQHKSSIFEIQESTYFMSITIKNHSEYFQEKASIENLNNAIQEKGVEIDNIKQMIAEIKISVSNLNGKLKTVNTDMASGKLSTDDFVSLKREIGQKENDLTIYSDALTAQNTAADILRSNLTQANRALNIFRQRIAKDIYHKIPGEITETAGEQLRNLVYCILAEKDPGDRYEENDIYQKIGAELCKSIFGEINEFRAKIPNIFESRQRLDEIITELA